MMRGNNKHFLIGYNTLVVTFKMAAMQTEKLSNLGICIIWDNDKEILDKMTAKLLT